jgi:LytS/YehU family sensor histidine kinase
MSAIVILQFLIATLLPIAASAVLYACERRQLAITLDPRRWMLLVGCAFGLIAVIGTEVGIPQDGAIMNVRDAAPLCAGLLFGGPAGIIAGLIGGVERWFASYWGAGDFTRLACSLATILVGFGAALLRARMFDHKRPAWPFALAIGVV